jgi:hypothetical protein
MRMISGSSAADGVTNRLLAYGARNALTARKRPISAPSGIAIAHDTKKPRNSCSQLCAKIGP